MNRLPIRRFGWIALAVVLALSVTAPAALAQDSGPRTITDFVGRQVTLESAPQKVIGLSKSINEMLFALGVTPVGVTADMDFPPAAAGLPVIGTGYAPALEAIAALEPDLIIANAQLQMDILPQLEDIAPTMMVMTLTPQDVIGNIRLLGQATWTDTTAEYLALTYENTLELASAIGAAHAEQGPSVLIVVGTLDQPNYGKSATYLGAMVAMLGGRNVADAEPDAGPFPGYAQLSTEAILNADPDVILTITRGAPAPMNETMAADPVWSALSAVANGRAYELDYKVFLEAPGPRFVEALTQVHNLLYGTE